jgi:hypothetical protein
MPSRDEVIVIARVLVTLSTADAGTQRALAAIRQTDDEEFDKQLSVSMKATDECLEYLRKLIALLEAER